MVYVGCFGPIAYSVQETDDVLIIRYIL